MLKRSLLLATVVSSALMSTAQVTDPLIKNWWFNTTNNKYKNILTDVEAVYYNQQNLYVKTSGVPNYYQDGVNHNNAKDLQAVWQIPRTSTPATTPAGMQGGQCGLMLDGTLMFTPGDAQSYNNAGVWNRLAYYFEGVDMDVSNGHSTPDNMYHHHFDNLKLHTFDDTKHAPIVAYAWDGYPVYGPYGYANADGTGGIKRMQSGYQTKTYSNNQRTNGPAVNGQYPIGCFVEDWEYVAGSGDLDEHNGRFCKTPEYPDGTYAYFTTIDANQKPYYPYFIGPTLYGSFGNSNLGPNGGKSTIPNDAIKYTSVKEVELIEANIELFPVPVTDYLHISLKENKNYTVVLYGMQGNILHQQSINGSDKVDMSSLPHGTYFIEVTETALDRGFIKRIVKQ